MLNSTFSHFGLFIYCMNSAIWLDCTLKLYYASCQSKQLMSF